MERAAESGLTQHNCLLWLACDTDLCRFQWAALLFRNEHGGGKCFSQDNKLKRHSNLARLCRIPRPWGGVALRRRACGGDAHDSDRVWGRWQMYPDPLQSWSRQQQRLHMQSFKWPRRDVLLSQAHCSRVNCRHIIFLNFLHGLIGHFLFNITRN